MNAPLLELAGIDKFYPGVQALRGASFSLNAGETHALIGENGAGKSTLMRILAGAERPDAGQLKLDGKALSFQSPLESKQYGISIIHQELSLVQQLSAAENIFLGREPSCFGFVSYRQMNQRANELLRRLGADFDAGETIEHLSAGRQQLIEIAKALALDCRILAMDEPSSSLSPHEVERLFDLVQELNRQGIAVIYITHRLDEIDRICSRVTVFRDGETMGCWPVGELARDELIERMAGRKVSEEFPPRVSNPGEEMLRVEGLTGGMVSDVSFSVMKGEIVALAGLVGAGRTETARMLFGADPVASGTIHLEGVKVRFRSPREAVVSGLALLTEDRKRQGLHLDLPLYQNATMASLKRFSRFGALWPGRERTSASERFRELNVKTRSVDAAAKTLSGGNQQKVVLAKWLMSEGRLFIFDEPTRGIDVGAKREIYLLMNRLAERGAGILMISSDLNEVMGMADRILVMREGRLSAELKPNETDQNEILRHAAPLSRASVAATG